MTTAAVSTTRHQIVKDKPTTLQIRLRKSGLRKKDKAQLISMFKDFKERPLYCPLCGKLMNIPVIDAVAGKDKKDKHRTVSHFDFKFMRVQCDKHKANVQINIDYRILPLMYGGENGYQLIK